LSELLTLFTLLNVEAVFLTEARKHEIRDSLVCFRAVVRLFGD